MRFKVFFLLLFPLVAQGQIMKSVALGDAESYEPTVAINRKSPENIVIAASPGVSFNSLDSGKTWKAVPLKTSGQDFGIYSGRKGDIYCIYVNRAGEVDKFVTVHSADGGGTWNDVGTFSIDSKNVADPALTLNPKTSDVMMTWTEFDAYGSSESDKVSNIMLSSSKDGKKWTEPLRINATSGDCLDGSKTPRGAVPISTMDGKLFVGWSFDDKVYLDRSFDKGGLWISGDIFVHNQPGGWKFDVPDVPNANGLPTLTIDNSPSQYHGSLFIVLAEKKKDQDASHVYMLRSHNLGDNWTTPLQIVGDSIKSENQFMPVMSVDPTSGIVYIAYYSKGNADDDLADVYLAYSVDNGNSFKNKRISDESFSLSGNIGEHIAIDSYRGNIAIAWTTVTDDKRHVEAVVIKQNDIIKLPNRSGGKKKKK